MTDRTKIVSRIHRSSSPRTYSGTMRRHRVAQAAGQIISGFRIIYTQVPVRDFSIRTRDRFLTVLMSGRPTESHFRQHRRS